MENRLFTTLERISLTPEVGTKAYEDWLEHSKFIQFLLEPSEEVPLYVSFQHTYIYSVFLPLSALRGNYVDQLREWDCSPTSSWGYGYSFDKRGKPKDIRAHAPMDLCRPALLKGATPAIWLRRFDGRRGNKSYLEVNQTLTHLHGLHFDESTNAYCRLDDAGDIEPCLVLNYSPSQIVVTLKRDIADFHMFLTKTVMVRFFDRMVCRDWKRFGGWGADSHLVQKAQREVYWRHGQISFTNQPEASYIRGFQIVRNQSRRRKLVAMATGESLERKKYAKFIAWDWKNKKLGTFSCDPSKLGNYFVKSDKPYETTPAFFKPEVLLRYKADPEKYTVEDRHITCRGTWGLETYDINEAGQVHTYLIYLSRLPYSEQLYWKSFNEKPKGGISRRAIRTDFEASWDADYDPLNAMKASLKQLASTWPKLWECHDEASYTQLNYPVTNAEKEWADEIHNLSKLVVEGLKYPYLKAISTSLDCFDPKHQTVKLLKAILLAKEVNNMEVDGIIAPLKEIQLLRTKIAGHRKGDEAKQLVAGLMRKWGSLRDHFRTLVTQTDKALNVLLGLKF